MSYKEGCHPIFQYSEVEKQEIIKEFGLTESGIQEDIDAIVEWFEKQPHLIDAGIPDRDFVERMLIWAKGSREKTKKRIDNYYKYRSLIPELIQNRHDYLESNKELWTFFRQVSIPKLYELKRISVVQFNDPDPKNFDCEIMFRNSALMGDLRTKYDYMIGDIWILDLEKTGFRHLLKMNPFVAQKATQIFQDGMGIRMCAIHIIGAPSYAQQVVNFFRQFVKSKIIDRVLLHESLEELYKYVPKKYLPKDYGGEQASMDDFKEKYEIILKSEETKQILTECSKMISNETKRADIDIHDEYLPGSFKKLDLD